MQKAFVSQSKLKSGSEKWNVNEENNFMQMMIKKILPTT